MTVLNFVVIFSIELFSFSFNLPDTHTHTHVICWNFLPLLLEFYLISPKKQHPHILPVSSGIPFPGHVKTDSS